MLTWFAINIHSLSFITPKTPVQIRSNDESFVNRCKGHLRPYIAVKENAALSRQWMLQCRLLYFDYFIDKTKYVLLG
jgi:hypothetical protein